jgi:hypothetical protein
MSRRNRYQLAITRQSDQGISEDHWLKQFEKTLQKGAVQPRTQQSLFDQINSIMNGNTQSRHSSVEAAVEDMKERSGLTAYLDKISKSSSNEAVDSSAPRKTAQQDTNQIIDKRIPIVFKKCPQVSGTLDNYIRDTKGNIPVPAIIDKLRSIHHGDVSDAKDWEDDNLILEVSKRNLTAKQSNPESYQNYSNLGTRDQSKDSDIDPSNRDAFFGLNPAKI